MAEKRDEGKSPPQGKAKRNNHSKRRPRNNSKNRPYGTTPKQNRIERHKKEKLLQELTGDSFSFFERLQNKIFGSPRYDIISIEPDIFKEKPPGRICANIEIRKNGVVVYFRFNHDEYALATRFHQLTIMKGKNFVIQLNTHKILLKISNSNQHLTFVRNLINQKAKFCGSQNNIPMNSREITT